MTPAFNPNQISPHQYIPWNKLDEVSEQSAAAIESIQTLSTSLQKKQQYILIDQPNRATRCREIMDPLSPYI